MSSGLLGRQPVESSSRARPQGFDAATRSGSIITFVIPAMPLRTRAFCRMASSGSGPRSPESRRRVAMSCRCCPGRAGHLLPQANAPDFWISRCRRNHLEGTQRANQGSAKYRRSAGARRKAATVLRSASGSVTGAGRGPSGITSEWCWRPFRSCAGEVPQPMPASDGNASLAIRREASGYIAVVTIPNLVGRNGTVC